MFYIRLITILAFVFALHKNSLIMRKPVFGVCDHVMHKQAYSDYRTVARILKFWLAASGVTVLFRKQMTIVLIRLDVQVGLCLSHATKSGFLMLEAQINPDKPTLRMKEQ